tara:strand:+ start:103 stop:483 length:381 start_codon:yes stop_codon:yes gene_type:complete
MAGKIIADTLEHSTAGTVDTQYVVNGSAKMFAFIEGDGTPTVTGSFNTASLTDEGTGVVRANLTNSMSDTTFTNIGLPKESGFKCMIQELTTGDIRSTSSMVLKSHSTSATADIDGRNYMIFGDLA